MTLDQETFENKCIEVIEKVILLDINQDRKGAVVVAKNMLDKAKSKLEASKAKNAGDVLAIYERVFEEFSKCTDQEYNILKKQLFSDKN